VTHINKTPLYIIMFTFIDLFCGIGGFHIALSELGGKCVFACDIDKECRKVYKENFGMEPEGDITKVDENNVPDHDVLVGGFPCQPMSNGGHKKAFDDKRGKLFDEIVRIARAKKPKVMILENVKHIKKVSDSQVYKYIYEQLQLAGYYVQDVEVSPHDLGVPQLRPRIFFVCLRQELYNNDKIVFAPVSSEHQIFQDEREIDSKYKLQPELIQVIDKWNIMLNQFDKGQRMSVPILLEEFQKVYDNMTVLAKWKQNYIKKNQELYQQYKDKWDEWLNKHRELLFKKVVYSRLEWQAGPLKGNDSIWNQFIQVRQSGIRVKKNDNFPTLVAIVQVPIYGKEKRYLTPRECARLQSFPESFKLHANDKLAYKQFGNSVNVEVVKFVMETVLSKVSL
jgi:DNA (cytosine-5)-methyltransferase 1